MIFIPFSEGINLIKACRKWAIIVYWHDDELILFFWKLTKFLRFLLFIFIYIISI